MSAPRLAGSLAVPRGAAGVVVVVVRSPGERRQPSRIAMADFLHHFGYASLLTALEAEGEVAGALGIEQLAGRVADAVRYVQGAEQLGSMPIGILGVGDAAGPALLAGAHLGGQLAAVVASGGRPDLAGAALGSIEAPTLLVAGGNAPGLDAARAAVRAMAVGTELAVVDDTADPNADPEGVGTVCWLAQRWFADHLGRATA